MRRKGMLSGAVAAVVGLMAVFAVAVPAGAAPGDGVVSGTVSVPAGHAVTGVDLYLVTASGDSVVAGPVSPDGAGAYQFTGVADGTYTVFAETPADTLAWQWSGAGRDASEAVPVTVTDGSPVAGVDFSLVAGASISGTITVPSGHAPEDSGAFADRPEGAAAVAPPGTVTAAGQYAGAASDGTYTIGNLPNLTWLVRFVTMGNALEVKYYDGAYTAASATTLAPTAGQAITGIDANLAPSSLLVITGTLKDATSSLCYSVRNGDSSVTRSGCSEPGVAQALEVVPPGAYIVSAWESNATHGDTAHLWWNDTAADRKVEANATGFTPSAVLDDPILEATFNFTALLFPDEMPARSISLRLVNFADGGSASGGCMRVYKSSQSLVGEDCTADDGVYNVDDLADGVYRVALVNFVGAAPTQWFDRGEDFAGASPISIVSGSSFSGSYTLLEPNSVVGVVRDGNGDPLAGLTVIMWDEFYRAGGYTEIERVVTDASGRFASGNVGPYPGIWVKAPVGVADYFQTTVYNDSRRPEVIAPVVLDRVEGTITGTLEAPDSFQSDDVCVFAYQAVHYGHAVGHACGPQGEPFVIHHLQPGEYTLRFIDSGNPGDLDTAPSAWSGYGAILTGLRDSSNSLYVRATVTEGAATPVTFTWGGTLRATATVSSGAFSGGCVDVYGSWNGPHVGTDCEPEAGVFEISVPDDGQYTILYRDFVGAFDRWHTAASERVYATNIVVRNGLTTAVTTSLSPWGRFTGTISVPAGVAPGDACMFAASADGGDFYGEACVDSETGAYSLTAPPGTYWLQFFTRGAEGATEWFDDAGALADAKTVTMVDSPVTANAVLAVAGAISGDVTLPDGTPADGSCVYLYEIDGDAVDETCVDDEGHYSLGSLAEGSYVVYFSGFDGWAGEWYADGSVFSQATPLVVVPGAAVTADAELVTSGTVSGYVTAPGGAAALHGCVKVYDADGEWYDESCVDATGYYAVNVPAGTYRLLFSAFSDASGRILASEWSGNARSYAAATTISVTPGRAIQANAELTLGGSVTGATRVTYGDELALGGCVSARDTATRVLIDFGCVDDFGRFEIHLATGQYLLQFWGFEGENGTRLVTTWFEAVPGGSMATPVAVTAGATTALPASFVITSGFIYGTVTLPPGASMDGTIDVYDGATGDYLTSVEPALDGSYLVDGLPANRDLRVNYAGFTGAANRWNGGAVSFQAASQVWPTPTGRNLGSVALGASGQISGTYPFIPSAGSGEACVVAWFVSEHFAAESCGAVGDAFVLDHLPPAGYYLEFFVRNEHVAWYSPWSGWHTRGLEPYNDGVGVTGGSVYVVGPTATLTGPASAVPGSTLTFSVDVDPAVTGTATVWVKPAGGAWMQTTKTFAVTSGVGSFTTAGPGVVQEYRVTIAGGTSNAVEITPVLPTATLAGPTSAAPGTTLSFSVAVDPAVTGTATVWVKPAGGGWIQTAKTFPVVAGSGGFTTAGPSMVMEYQVTVAGATSNAVEVTPVLPTATLTGPTSAAPGTTLSFSVAVDPAVTGTATVWVKPAGGGWIQTAKTLPVTGGVGSFTTVGPGAVQEYRVTVAGATSNAVQVTPVLPTATLTGPSSAVPGSTLTFSVDVDPDVTGAATVWVKPAGAGWIQTAKTFAVTGGVGSFTTAGPGMVIDYQVTVAGATSNAVQVTPVLPTATLTGPTSAAPGTTLSFSVSVDPALTGTATVWVKPAGGGWIQTAKTFAVTGGAGSFTTAGPGVVQEYRVTVAGATSNAIAVTPVLPTATLTGPTSAVPGSMLTFSVAVDPAVTGTATVWVKPAGAGWIQTAKTFAVTGGAGSFTTAGPGVVQEYRVTVAGATSNAVAVTPVAPTVTLVAGGSSTPGGTATLAFTVDPVSNGVARVWVRIGSGAWFATAKTFAVTAGTGGTTTKVPTQTQSYRIEYLGTFTDPVVLGP